MDKCPSQSLQSRHCISFCTKYTLARASAGSAHTSFSFMVLRSMILNLSYSRVRMKGCLLMSKPLKGLMKEQMGLGALKLEKRLLLLRFCCMNKSTFNSSVLLAKSTK
eukprot:CAMPEP_0170548362 /NCGR_PEP_ID=MMETSP0211-20121228/6681_1 /TAXON_ID=311385 /ORGANISM="Pseudokeronopsis sp., Strain OXSARD2" /LENGTH=107 /DNA_ID=CAMNT_0010853871 /DNA_START=64 /DNA_END=390 /DNA_ORIENTATION=-